MKSETIMTPQEINRRIAIACGWKLLFNSFPPNSRLWEHPSGKRAYEPDDLPNYHGDLNAMHEAEKVLTHGQASYYLSELIGINTKDESTHHGSYHATAAQRAEAFLRTIGQWEEVE
jgi:hypothetical protein